MTEWNPIRTAPKDGTRVILYRPGYREDIIVGYWSDYTDYWNAVNGDVIAREVTNWIPLPEPPK